MFGWAKSPTFQDPDFGGLTRKRGLWRGLVTLGEGPAVPLALSGPQREPDPAARAAVQELIAPA